MQLFINEFWSLQACSNPRKGKKFWIEPGNLETNVYAKHSLAFQCATSASFINLLCRQNVSVTFFCAWSMLEHHFKTSRSFHKIFQAPSQMFFSGQDEHVSFFSPCPHLPGGWGIQTAAFSAMILPPQLPGSCRHHVGFFEIFIQDVHEILSLYCWNVEIFTYAMSGSFALFYYLHLQAGPHVWCFRINWVTL